MYLVVQIAGAIAWLAALAGCLLLHFRLRNFFSASFVLSIAVVALWSFWGRAALVSALALPAPTIANAGQGNSAAEALSAVGNSHVVVSAMESILMIWFGVSFFFAIKSIRSQRAD